jgi:putative transposase
MKGKQQKSIIHSISTVKSGHLPMSPTDQIHIKNLVRELFVASGCPVLIINIMPDHVHCLFLLNPEYELPDVMKLIKSRTAYMINRNSSDDTKFEWKKRDAAFTVGIHALSDVTDDINNQKDYHRAKTLKDELAELKNGNGINFQTSTTPFNRFYNHTISINPTQEML